MKLSDHINLGNKATRDGFGEGFYHLGKTNDKVVGLTADLMGSMKMDAFAKDWPDRFVQVGIAEANMMGVAAGLAIGGYIPYTGTFANFSTGRVYDQIRQSIAYSHKNVKICASHAGLTLGEDGATHQILEDLGLMRMLPGMTVINPCDSNQTRAAAIAIASWDGPVYLRFGRPSVPNFTPLEREFKIGKADVLSEGKDITLVACGHMVWKCIEAARELEMEGLQCEVINLATIKPLDEETILKSLAKTRALVTAEEHQINGGIGDMLAGLCGRKLPIPIEMVAVMDSFGESGKPDELLVKYGLTTQNIILKAKACLSRKF